MEATAMSKELRKRTRKDHENVIETAAEVVEVAERFQGG
jgi:hypothetical protein